MEQNDSIFRELDSKKKELLNIIEFAEKKLSLMPAGSIRIRKHHNGVQFYYQKDSRDRAGAYMARAEDKKAIALLQKPYLLRMQREARKQLHVIDHFLRFYDPNALKEVYLNEGCIRRKYIQPLVVPDYQYIEQWQNEEYSEYPIPEGVPIHYTNKRERVRSKSEVMIANALAQAGIPYRYECPLVLKKVTIHPDFTVLRVRDRRVFYWEHLGMIDDLSYIKNAAQRIHLYQSEGFYPGDPIIITTESYGKPLNNVILRQIIEHYFI